jgi:hypothetical protein
MRSAASSRCQSQGRRTAREDAGMAALGATMPRPRQEASPNPCGRAAACTGARARRPAPARVGRDRPRRRKADEVQRPVGQNAPSCLRERKTSLKGQGRGVVLTARQGGSTQKGDEGSGRASEGTRSGSARGLSGVRRSEGRASGSLLEEGAGLEGDGERRGGRREADDVDADDGSRRRFGCWAEGWGEAEGRGAGGGRMGEERERPWTPASPTSFPLYACPLFLRSAR